MSSISQCLLAEKVLTSVVKTRFSPTDVSEEVLAEGQTASLKLVIFESLPFIALGLSDRRKSTALQDFGRRRGLLVAK